MKTGIAASLVGLTIVVVTVFGLATGTEWLLIDPFGTGLPLGTLATAVSMTVLPALGLPWACPGPGAAGPGGWPGPW